MSNATRKRPMVCQLRVAVGEIEPPIWRRLQLLTATNVGKLVYALQEVFDWEGDEEARFFAGGVEIANAEKLRLEELGPEGTVLVCAYGDWRLELTIERVFVALVGVRYPTCYEGERAAPPETCGGPRGYAAWLAAGGDDELDPEHCDLDAADRRLRYSDRS